MQQTAGSEEEQSREERKLQVAEAEERRQQSERKLHETLSVLKENVADTSGEALWSSASSQVTLSLAFAQGLPPLPHDIQTYLGPYFLKLYC